MEVKVPLRYHPYFSCPQSNSFPYIVTLEWPYTSMKHNSDSLYCIYHSLSLSLSLSPLLHLSLSLSASVFPLSFCILSVSIYLRDAGRSFIFFLICNIPSCNHPHALTDRCISLVPRSHTHPTHSFPHHSTHSFLSLVLYTSTTHSIPTPTSFIHTALYFTHSLLSFAPHSISLLQPTLNLTTPTPTNPLL